MNFVLGAGMTGLAAGISSGLPVFEASSHPGGICKSYYIMQGNSNRIYRKREEINNAYRFEFGGGRWIFSNDQLISRYIQSMVQIKTYSRISSVYFSDKNLFVPYPVQHNLRYFDSNFSAKSLIEISQDKYLDDSNITMEDWLQNSFGTSLSEIFFSPFHELYTAGLWKNIAPLDKFKSPVNFPLAIKGAFSESKAAGYNSSFFYPIQGLDTLSYKMAELCDIHYGKEIVSIDIYEKKLRLANGKTIAYDSLISTLPLNQMISMSGLELGIDADPYTSVLVINIGAVKGLHCPSDYWVYIPKSKTGFHRVGFYSNVDISFLPSNDAETNQLVSLYVEKAFLPGSKPNNDEIIKLCNSVIEELRDWGWIEEIQVINDTWIEIAYTWSWVKSNWKKLAIDTLQDLDIYQVGRYGKWAFQGIADSIRDGLLIGSMFKNNYKL